MLTLRLALVTCWRRRALALVTLLAVIAPVLCAGTMWVIQHSSMLTPEQSNASLLGEGQASLVPRTLDDTPAGRSAIAHDISAGGVRASMKLTAYASVVVVSGMDRTVRVHAREWATTFRQTLTVVDGRSPGRPGECASTPGLAALYDLHIGDTVTVAGRPCHIVGLATEPAAGRRSEVLFALPQQFSAASQIGRVEWIVAPGSPLPSQDIIDRWRLTVVLPETESSASTILDAHPLEMGGSLVLVIVCALACIRFLLARDGRTSSAALASIGATRRQLLALSFLQAVIPATLGAGLGLAVIGAVAVVVPSRVADTLGIEVPRLPDARLEACLLVLLTVLLVSTSSLIEHVSPESPTVLRGQPRVDRPGTALRLGLRLALSHPRRTLLLTVTTLVISAIPAAMLTVLATAQAQQTLTNVSNWREGEVVLELLDKRPSPALTSDLSTLLGVPVAEIHDLSDRNGLINLTTEQETVEELPGGISMGCVGGLLVTDDMAWEAVAGRGLSPRERGVLDHGGILRLSTACAGPLVLQRSDGSTTPAGTAAPTDPVDLPAKQQTGTIMGPSGLRRLGLTSTPTRLVLRLDHVPPASVQDAASATVERHGYSATLLHFGVPSDYRLPPLAIALQIELLALLLVVSVTACIAVGLDDRATHRALDMLGATRTDHTLIHGGAVGTPLLVGIASGLAVGLLVGRLLTSSGMQGTPVQTPLLAFAPGLVALVLPAVLAATARAR